MKPNRECGSLLSVRVIAFAPHPPLCHIRSPTAACMYVRQFVLTVHHSRPDQSASCLLLSMLLLLQVWPWSGLQGWQHA